VSEREAVRRLTASLLYQVKRFLDPSSYHCGAMMLKVYTAGEEEEE
jgi:hypothetical protein